jgi:hypothetical protein
MQLFLKDWNWQTRNGANILWANNYWADLTIIVAFIGDTLTTSVGLSLLETPAIILHKCLLSMVLVQISLLEDTGTCGGRAVSLSWSCWPR